MEAVTEISLNFTNGGGGHTATVKTILNPKNIQTGEDLGTVIGDMGEVNIFSNDKIATLMSNFVCTGKTKSATPATSTISRKYVDKTTLLLKSIVVLLRGVSCGPREKLDFQGEVPQFTEVINAPYPLYDSEGRSFPFPSSGPVRHGSVISVGRIYNYESAAEFGGIKITLVYNNMKLKPELSMNDERASDSYKLSPDLSQYDLKYGYTLDDFKKMIASAGLTIDWGEGGEPASENVLFESQGTLSSVLGTVASYFGFFWYVNPQTGTINFVNTEIASTLEILDYTDTTIEEHDENIISATFTESLTTDKLVNTYSGTSEKQDDKAPKDDDRPKPIFFKRYYLEQEEAFEFLGMGEQELGCFFGCFNQAISTDMFDKYTYGVFHLNTVNKLEALIGRNITPDLLYKLWPACNVQQWNWNGGKKNVWGSKAKAEHADNNNSKLDFDRVKDKFKYSLCNHELREVMPRPSGTKLYEFLKNYFDIAGGIFVSNGYGEYKADRMEFTNMNNITVTGPFKQDVLIEDIDELSQLNDVFKILDVKGKTVKDLASTTNDEAVVTGANKHYFVAIRNIPKLERHNGELADEAIDFKPLGTQLEFYQHPRKKNKLWCGGPIGLKDTVEPMIVQSYQNYVKVLNAKKSLRLEYIRKKTRVNNTPEESEEAEDDEVAEDKTGTESKMSELFDRFDYRYFSVEKPKHSLLNNLSISNSSGSTTEMIALAKARGGYSDAGDSPKASSRLLYGIHIPEISPTVNGISISVGSGGIQTTINESTIKLIPPDSSFLQMKGMESIVTQNGIASWLSAKQKNLLGL